MRRKGGPRRKSAREMAGGIRAMILSLGKRVGEGEGDLTLLVGLEPVLEQAIAQTVARLRANGMTDGQIGELLGRSRQAVSQKWPAGGRYRGAAGRYRRRKDEEDENGTRTGG
jgi:hypothetical protein